MAKYDFAPVNTSKEARDLVTEIYDSLRSEENRPTRCGFMKKTLIPVLKNEYKKNEKNLDTLLLRLYDLASPKTQEIKDDILLEMSRKIIKEDARKSYFISFEECIIKPIELMGDQRKKNMGFIEAAHYLRAKSLNESFYSLRAVLYDIILDAYIKVLPQNREEQSILEKALQDDKITRIAEEGFAHKNYELAAKAYTLVGEYPVDKKIASLFAKLESKKLFKNARRTCASKTMFDRAQAKLKVGDVKGALTLFKLCNATPVVEILEQTEYLGAEHLGLGRSKSTDDQTEEPRGIQAVLKDEPEEEAR